MSQKILPKENSVYTNASLEPYQSPTQQNARSSKGSEKLGINGTPAFRELPAYNSIKSNKILNHNNGFINICEDAPQGPGTGYSAFGTPASSVDIVCGRVTSIPEVSRNSKIFVNDNFLYDAARIYVSETTDLEDNFSMPQGDNIRQEAKSGIGAQADVIALKGKTGIKLTTGQYGERNSKGGKIRSGSGIELIAGTYTENLQPLVLGDNHVDSMIKIIKRINELTDAVIDLAQVHNNSILLLQSHSHPLGVDPATGLPGAAPSPVLLGGLALNFTDNTVMGIMNGTVNKINLLFDDINYLSALGFSSVNSDLNRTN
tara:strand:+ start:5495 stop:6445 length:951 start_codon:yes stop_codon:yes gene_type:complete